MPVKEINNAPHRQKPRKLRRGSQPYNLLKTLVIAGGVVLISTLSPSSGALLAKGLIKGYFRKKNFEKFRFLNDLKNLQKRELADYEELPNGDVRIVLLKKGKEVALRYNLDDIQLQKPKKWDGAWRMIMFDIPHNLKAARDALREKLQQLGCYRIQKSVFITPYPCEKEVDFIALIFEVRDYVLLFYVGSFEGEEKFRHHFKI